MATEQQNKHKRGSLVYQAYDLIKERIIGNYYPPNSQVLERELADEMGVSRTPIREALIRLENEGLVEILPRRGMRIVPIFPEDMQEIYEVLMLLESRAAERLAEQKPSKRELGPLLKSVKDMERAVDKQDLDAWVEADKRFHRLLVETCGNQRIASVALNVFDQVHRAQMVTLRMRPFPNESVKDHRAVVEAILEHDSRKAYRIHYEHRKRTMRLLTEILERYNLSRL